MNSALQTALHSWTPPLVTIAALLALAALYARGFARLHRQMPRRFPAWRLAVVPRRHRDPARRDRLAARGPRRPAPAGPHDAASHPHDAWRRRSCSQERRPSRSLRGLSPRFAKAVVGRALRARPRPPRIRMAHQSARMLDRIRRRDLVLAHPRDLSARPPLRRLARRRARMLFHHGADVLVSGHPAVAEPPRDGRDGR